MDDGAIDAHLRRQHGVISRAQVLGADGDDDLIEQRIRHRVWARVFPGVYATHTGPLTWHQRAWAAVLYHAPSALAGHSALQAHGLGTQAEADPIELVIAHGRRVTDRPGMRTIRTRDFAATTQLQRDPPRVRVERAVLQVADDAATEDRAVAVIADACQRGRTTTARLRQALDETVRASHRSLLEEVLGATSDRAPTPPWRRGTSATSNGPTHCPGRVANSARPTAPRPATATRRTRCTA